MSRLRFSTARAVFEAFPALAEVLRTEAREEPPLSYLRALEGSETPEDAVAFAAFMLPRREAVWWALQTVRAHDPNTAQNDAAALAAAEAWVRQPEDGARFEAMRIGNAASPEKASTWVAFAAAYSGGSIVEGPQHVPCPPEITAKAARLAVLTALAGVPARDRSAALAACIERAIRLTEPAPA